MPLLKHYEKCRIRGEPVCAVCDQTYGTEGVQEVRVLIVGAGIGGLSAAIAMKVERSLTESSATFYNVG